MNSGRTSGAWSWLVLATVCVGALACTSQEMPGTGTSSPQAGAAVTSGTGGTTPNAAGSGGMAVASAAGSGVATAGSAAAGSAGLAAAGNGGAGGTLAAGTGGAGTGTSGSDAGPPGADCNAEGATERFSFFVTSLAGMRRLSGSEDGFGGDLRFGHEDGLSGADAICTELAEASYPGAGCKTWRAFLSVTEGPAGNPVHAADRIGEGPWYDRLGRLVAMDKSDLLQAWPVGADPVIMQDLPNEDGVPNHDPDGTGQVDNHNTVTGSNAQGMLADPDWASTCHDWTSAVGTDGRPIIGFSWYGGAATFPGSGWYFSDISEGGCGPYVNLDPRVMDRDNRGIGAFGGYGGIYCLALEP